MEYGKQLEAALKNLQKLTGVNFSITVNSKEEETFALQQLQNLYKTYKEKYDCVYFLQSLLQNEWTLSNVSNWAKKAHVSAGQRRVVYLIRSQNPFGENVPEILRNTVVDPNSTFIIPMCDHEIAVIHSLNSADTEEHILQYAYIFIDSILAEAMTRVKAAYSEPVAHLQMLHKAWENVRLAMDVGETFYESNDVYSYSRLGTGGLLYQLPASAREKFLKEIFPDNALVLSESGTRQMLECFFFNNLNVSVTAKQLKIHRNTLLNRLERIEKETGLSLRDIDDVTTFKLALMLIDYAKHQTKIK